MKKFSLCIVLAFVFALCVSSNLWATGVCIEDDNFSDAYYLSVTGGGGGVYGAHGYEYGAGYSDTVMHGAIHLAGSYIYVGLNGIAYTYGGGEHGTTFHEVMVLNASTWQGPGKYAYIYEYGGVVSGFGGDTSFTMNYCSPPGIATGAKGPSQAGE